MEIQHSEKCAIFRVRGAADENDVRNGETPRLAKQKKFFQVDQVEIWSRLSLQLQEICFKFLYLFFAARVEAKGANVSRQK